MTITKKLAIVTTHPIQYNAPLFSLLHARGFINIKVFYSWGESVSEDKYDPGFGEVINWDIPLLEGYNFEFEINTATKKGSHHFKGIINPKLIENISIYHPDSILVFGWAYQSHLKIIRYFKNKIPVFFRGDSTLLDNSFYLKRFLRKLTLRWVYSKIDFALYVGKNNYDYYLFAGMKQAKLKFAGHAIDNNRFSSQVKRDPNNTIFWRKELNISKSDLVFLFAGKMEEKKDPYILLKAFVNASFNNNIHLIMAGSGELKVKLTSKFANHSNIHFIDFVNQSKMPSLYLAADVFVLPSKGPGETWGLVVNEAMASGKPVLVSNKCGCAIDLVKDDLNGYIFQAENRNDLTSKLIKMLDNRSRLLDMGLASLKIISSYSFSNIASVIEGLTITDNEPI